MFNVSVGKEVDAALARMINALSDAQQIEALTAAGRAAGVAAESVVSPYPPASGKPLPLYYTRVDAQGKPYKSKFKSMKQQRLVLSLAARGKIPTRRSGTLGKSIQSSVVEVTAKAVTVSIGSNKGYAPYVIDRIRQSHYHRGTWTPLQDDIQRGLPIIAAAVNKAYAAKIRAIIQP